MAQLEKDGELSVVKKNRVSDAKLEKELTWNCGESIYFPKKEKVTSLNVATICGRRIFDGLQDEVNLHILGENDWREVIAYGDIDFILIESCFESHTGSWSMDQIPSNLGNGKVSDLLEFAKKKKVPTVYWFTLDHQYHHLFSEIAGFFDFVFCADKLEVTLLHGIGVTAHLLLPAVQPSIYNPLTHLVPGQRKKIGGVCDGLAQTHSAWNEDSDLYAQLADIGTLFFDSRSSIWRQVIGDIALPDKNVLGTLRYKPRISLLKRVDYYCVFERSATTSTEDLWRSIEAAACRVPVVYLTASDRVSFDNEFRLIESSNDSFLIELVRMQKDNFYREKLAQNAFRKVLSYHTFSHRIKKICEHLGIGSPWNEYPKASLITPSNRVSRIRQASERYLAQSYPNKEWVVVFNGSFSKYQEVREFVEGVPGAKFIYAPSELHAGPCMNLGVQISSGEYIFRMDDDDYYGENYLLDTLLYSRAIDFDFSGKMFNYFVIKDKYPNLIFSKFQRYIRPSACLVKDLPGAHVHAGAAQGGKRDAFLKCPFDMKVYGAADSALSIDIKAHSDMVAVLLDDMEFIVDRRLASDHTWKVSEDQLLKGTESTFILPDELF